MFFSLYAGPRGYVGPMTGPTGPGSRPPGATGGPIGQPGGPIGPTGGPLGPTGWMPGGGLRFRRQVGSGSPDRPCYTGTIRYDTIRYDTRCYFNMRSKADVESA